jgi:nifR3 family TIM-barrel protein
LDILELIRNSKLEIGNSKKGVKNPFFALAPMANITTYPFASQCAKYGADLVWTPMVHTDTVINNWEETQKIIDFKDINPYIIQLVGSEPGKFARAIKIIESKGLKPLCIDINTGCPDKNIVKSGCGGSLLKTPDKIIDIVLACKDATELPISIKTRAGYDNPDDILDLAPRLIEAGVIMLTVHPRTVKQGYSGEADWSVIKNLVSSLSPHTSTVIVGSGDIKTWQEALLKQKETGCNGIMIGRGALGHPWIFAEVKEGRDLKVRGGEIKKLALDLATKADAIWGDYGIVESRKHFAWYFKGFDGAKEIRTKLMDSGTLKDVVKVLDR